MTISMPPKQRVQLSAFIAQKRAARSHAKRATSLDVPRRRADGRLVVEPIGFHFTPQRHRLTLEQCRLATWLLRRANTRKPIHGTSKQAQFRRALRIAGILSAVKGGRVGNSHFGYQLHGHRGGNVMRDHRREHLRRIGPTGRGAALAARMRQRALRDWQERQSHPQTFEEWQRELAAWPQQEQPKDFMSY